MKVIINLKVLKIEDMTEEEFKLDERTERVLKRKGYIIDKKLSAGAFGQVFKAKKEKSGEAAAVKVMDLTKLSHRFKEKFLPREMDALKQASHPHIVRIDDIFRSNKRIFIFMEFVGGGDAAEYLKKYGALNESKACKWFTQILEALNYLHNHLFIAHRDLKIDNILLTEDMQNTKLTDFGFAKEAWDPINNCVILSDSFCGTEPYYSPQLVKKVKYDPFKADVWAMGVVLFALLNNRFPFHFGKPDDMYREQTDERFLTTRITKTLSKHCLDLIKKMFELNENRRLGVNDVLKHKWIKEKGNCTHT